VGPTGVVNGAGDLRGIDWPFNAWGGSDGGLYAPWDLDDQVARKVLEVQGVPRYRAPLINEGGAFHVDGEGTALVTEQCLLNRNRNPTLSRGRIERHLQDYLGVQRVIWLGRGVFNDETDGHIDNLACFARPGEVCLTWCDDPADPQYAISNDALTRLRAARDARDRPLVVHKIPAPGPLYMTAREASGIQRKRGSHARVAGWRLAGSYVNFYLANGALVMPLLDPNTDRAAARVLKRLFPDRKVVGVAAREILLGGGNIHCITQQVPQCCAAGALESPTG
jgi:agmatine deiminase